MGACLSLARKSPNELAASALHAAADYINPVAQQHANTTAHHNNNTNNNNTYQYQQNNAQTHTITEAYVSKMPDGDTFTCSFTDHNGQQVTSRVRIQGIDCPELAQNFGVEAKKIGQNVLLHKTVSLHIHTTDRYGRLVAEVTTNSGINYGEYMLRNGAAWHYKAYSKDDKLAQLEDEARAQKIGLWSYARPQAPWDYRRRKREQQS